MGARAGWEEGTILGWGDGVRACARGAWQALLGAQSLSPEHWKEGTGMEDREGGLRRDGPLVELADRGLSLGL